MLSVTALWAGQWTALGPDGGDVRSLAFDPQNPDRIYLGTSTGTLFTSSDGGHNWARLSHLGDDDNVLDHIVIDPKNPKHIYVAAWSVVNQQAGDVFRSHDGGNNWEALPGVHGKSVRAMAIAPYDSKVLVIGALDGVFRTQNGGNSWERISPAGQAELKNVESIAVDPKNPDVVYAGTWHLAWKTDDSGASWHRINKGMIDDSDVFSVIVDSTNPSVVYASACSGIYKSDSAGDLFRKLQGIPFSARRTRVLRQDPNNSGTVYAGTTEGLWKTSDAGKTWKRVSNPEVVVNDVLIDPRNSSRVLLATDRSGVLASDNGAQTFVASNHGYTHRYVSSILTDKSDPSSILVGVVNDREFGGVFSTRDSGQSWQQKSAGLGGRDVFALQQAPNGGLIAGTNKGIFLLDRNASQWRPINTIVTEKTTARLVRTKTRKGARKVPATVAVRSTLDARVSDIEVTPRRWLAATSAGLLSSTDQGKSWTGGPVMGKSDFVAVESNGELLVAATRTSVLYSSNSGTTWNQAPLSAYITSIHGVTLTPEGEILIASREGAFRSSDSGATWEHIVNGLPDKNISSIAYDQSKKRLLATSIATGVIFESKDGGRSWHRGPDSGYPLRRVSVVRGRFVGATPFDGLIVQPENEAANASVGLDGTSN
ncbi:MAG: transcriptional regulator [Terriglobales bacterium]